MSSWAFDLDGVLAEGPPPSGVRWGRMKGPERRRRIEDVIEHYKYATLIWVPPETCGSFHVITARKDEPDVREATERWLYMQFGRRVQAVHMLNKARSIENVIEFKGSVLTSLGATDYAEDNKKVVMGLRGASLNTRIWLFNTSTCEMSI